MAVISELLFAAFCVYVATTQAGKEKDVLDNIIDDTNNNTSRMVEGDGTFQDQSSESIIGTSTINNNIDSEKEGSIEG